MKITYISETLLTNKSAQSVHVLKMCDAFCKKNDVEIIVPYIKKNFSLKKIKENFLLTAKKNIIVKSILNLKISNFLYRILFGYKAAIYLKNNNSEKSDNDWTSKSHNEMMDNIEKKMNDKSIKERKKN